MAQKKKWIPAKKIGPRKVKKLKQLLDTLVQSKASELILTTNAPPMLKKIDGLESVWKENLTPEQVSDYLYALLNTDQRDYFETHKNLDFSFGIAGMARFRGNAFFQRGAVTVVFTAIPFRIPTWTEIKGPKTILPLLKQKSGLIIVTGPTGSGKSTVMCSLIEYINEHFPYHIITLEDPIEYIYKHKKSIISQRWVGLDTDTFTSGLKYILRQAPDVVAINEIREPAHLEATITLAEAGCLCVILLHSPFCINAIKKIVEVFPVDEQKNIQERFADIFLCAVSSRLFLKKKGKGRLAAYEVLRTSAKVKQLIKKGSFAQLQPLLKPSLKSAILKLKWTGKII